MRRLLFAANWKMHVGPVEARAYLKTFRARYPEMYEEYRSRCKAEPRRFNLGDCWLWKAEDRPWVFNLGTQEVSWRAKASYEAIKKALGSMREQANRQGIAPGVEYGARVKSTYHVSCLAAVCLALVCSALIVNYSRAGIILLFAGMLAWHIYWLIGGTDKRLAGRTSAALLFFIAETMDDIEGGEVVFGGALEQRGDELGHTGQSQPSHFGTR